MADEKQKKKKLPTAEKRMIQNKKRQLENQIFKSRVRTAIRNFDKSLSEKKAKEEVQGALSTIYKLMDKGVKRGIFKKNKAARYKSKFTAKQANA